MPSLVGTKTGKNLKAAFAKSAEVHLRYLYFAQKADIEGYNDVFRRVPVDRRGRDRACARPSRHPRRDR
jgi:hypothetical protein